MSAPEQQLDEYLDRQCPECGAGLSPEGRVPEHNDGPDRCRGSLLQPGSWGGLGPTHHVGQRRRRAVNQHKRRPAD